MTSNVKRHVQLPRSSQKGKKPTADDLKYGEIAVNFNNEDPFLAIKGSDDSIITMGFKDGKTGPWKKGEGEYSAVLDNGIPTSPNDTVNTATKRYATAEGKGSTASGEYSHAEGFSTTASGDLASHAEGYNTIASGVSSHAEGSDTTASGEHSHAEGIKTTVSGYNSHTEGLYTTVNGTNSHGEGRHKLNLILIKNIAVGDTTIIIDNKQMSIPDNEDYIKNCYITDNDNIYKILTISSYTGTLPANFDGIAREITVDKPLKNTSNKNNNDDTFISDIYSFVNVAVGEIDAGHSEGKNNIVLGEAGHAEGKFTISKGSISHAEGYRTMASGDNSHSEGAGTTASGYYSHAEGQNTTASETNSHSEGYNTTARGGSSHAEGENTIASGESSHAEGSKSTAHGDSSHAEGSNTTAHGDSSHAEGSNTSARGDSSHAEGSNTSASGDNSHAGGSYTIAKNDSEFACGKYNKSNANQLFSIGIGNNNTNRKNAISVTQDGVISSDVVLTNGATSMTGLKISGGIESTNGMISPTYLNSSDERLKKDIETISENDIDKVKHVDFKSYKFKSDDSRHYGIIAQDVEKAGLTELVTNGADGMKSVDYISLLILKIAELENELKSLKEQIKK